MVDTQPGNHLRKHVRLRGFDYASPGAYFVTICTAGREPFLGTVGDGEMHLSDLGRIVEECWLNLPRHYPYLMLDAFVIMPDHLHAIFRICDDPVDGTVPPRRHRLSEMIRALKGFSTRRINERRGTPGGLVWQQNYYEHILRGEKELYGARHYINTNVLRQHFADLERDHPFGDS